MSEPLKPCPFCGGPATLDPQTSYFHPAVECDDCDARVAVGKVRGDNEAGDRAAIAAWNRRAYEEPQP